MEEEFDDGTDSTAEDADVREFLSGIFADTKLTEYSDEDKDLALLQRIVDPAKP